MATQFRSIYTGAQTDALLRKLHDTDWDELETTCTDAAEAASGAIDTVQDKKSEALTAINTAKTDAIAEVNEVLDDLETEVAGLEAAVDNRIRKFYTSNSLAETVSDSDDGNIRSLKIYGKGYQNSYSGKNLFANQNINATSYGVTLKIEGTKATLTGTSTQGFVEFALSNPITIQAGTYIGSVQPFGTSNFYIRKKGSPNTDLYLNKGTVLSDDTTFTHIFISGYSKGTVFNASTTIQIEEGSTATSYEPYVGGQPSPSPSYPQTVHSVVNPTVWSHGKNLFSSKWELGALYNNDNKVSATGRIRTKDFINVKPNTTYAIKRYENGAGYFNIYAYKENGTPTKEQNLIKSLNISVSFITFTTDSDTYKIKCAWLANTDINSRVQLEEGSTATAYVPYQGETTATLETTLNAIPVTSGGNVTIDGQQYIADYVDVEAKQIVRMCGKIASYNSETIGTPWLSTKDAYTSGGTPTSGATVIYKLATPTTESLTDDDIADFLALRSYYGSTTAIVTSDDLDGASEFLYPCSIETGWEYIKEQLGDTREFVYDVADISDEAYIQALVNAINLEFLMEE